MPDDLNLALDREVILVGGGPSTGKSRTIVELAIAGLEQEFNVVVIDRDRGIAKAVKELCDGTVPENMDYFIANSWEKVMQGVHHSFDILGPGDWLCFDMIGGLWDLAQDEFTRLVYEESGADKLLALRMEAEELVRTSGKKGGDASSERARGVGFEGLEGRYDWPLIKKMHNSDMRDNCILNGEFNILSTTAMNAMQDTDKAKWPMFSSLGRRPEGEKNNVHKHDTFALVTQSDGKFAWSTQISQGQGKDRGRELVRNVDYTDVGFVASYLEYHELGVYA